jgi:hypothetical protein
VSTPGVELVAETGATGTIQREIGSASGVGDSVIGVVTFIRDTEMQTFSSWAMTQQTNLLSTITMIAPRYVQNECLCISHCNHLHVLTKFMPQPRLLLRIL